MRGDGKTNKQKATNLNITKLSSVKNPAHKPAVASIIKSASEGTEETVVKRMFSDVMEQMGLDEEKRKFMHGIYNMTEAISDSMRAIMMNPSYTDKKAQMGATLGQFMAAMTGTIEGSTLIKSADIEDVLQRNTEMWKEMLEGFPLIKTTAIAEILSVEKGEGKMAGKKKVTVVSDKDLTPEEMAAKKIADAKAGKKATFKSIAAMTPESLEYFKTLDDDAQDAFFEKSADAQAADVILAKSLDETISVGGVSIKKSETSPGVFAILKQQQERIEKNELKVAKQADEIAMKEHIEKAEELLPNLAGTPEEKGQFYKTLMAMPEAQRETTITMLKASDEAQQTEYTEIGTSTKKSADLKKGAEDKLVSIAKGIQKENPTYSFEKAYSQAMDTPEGAEAYAATR